MFTGELVMYGSRSADGDYRASIAPWCLGFVLIAITIARERSSSALHKATFGRVGPGADTDPESDWTYH